MFHFRGGWAKSLGGSVVEDNSTARYVRGGGGGADREEAGCFTRAPINLRSKVVIKRNSIFFSVVQ